MTQSGFDKDWQRKWPLSQKEIVIRLRAISNDLSWGYKDVYAVSARESIDKLIKEIEAR